MRIGMAAILCGLFTTASAEADDSLIDGLNVLQGTLSVRSLPHRAEGKLLGCTLVYDSIYQDWTYRGGAFLKVTGNVGIMVIGDQMGANVKVVVQEIGSSGGLPTFSPSPPSRAYLVGGDLSTNLDTLVHSSASDTPGALFSVFQLSPTFEMVLAALEENELTIAFNNLAGETDMQIAIELNVIDINANGERTRSEEQKAGFLKCLGALFGS